MSVTAPVSRSWYAAGGDAWREAVSAFTGRGAPMPPSFRNAPDPSALCALTGRVLDRNPALEKLGLERSHVGEVVAELTDGDAGLVYRLSRSAVRLGFAL
ncbi:MAG: hypothetical protein AAGE83_13700, partial [Pseudomonadota bacterium]